MSTRVLRQSVLLTAALSCAIQRDSAAQPAETLMPDNEVRIFSSVCDGASDEAAALQTSFDSLADGATLSIPCQLSLGSAVRLRDKTGVTIRGVTEGAGLKALSNTGSGLPGGFGPLLFLIERCNRCIIEHLDIDLDRHGVGGIGVAGSIGTQIRHNVIRNAGAMSGGALSASRNVGNEYSDNRIQGIDGDTRGLWIGNHWENTLELYPRIRNNTVRQIAATGIAIHAVGAYVAGNSVEHTAGAGIKCVPGPAPTGVPTIIENNTLRNNAFNGIQIAHGHDMIVRTNTVEQNGGAGIYVVDSFVNAVIAGNVIRDNDLAYRVNGWQGGILIHQGSNVLIADNVIEDSRTGPDRTQTNGILLNAAQSVINNVRVERNTIRNHMVSGVQLSGRHRIDGVAVLMNVLTDNSEYGVSVSAAPAAEPVTLCGNASTGGRGYINPLAPVQVLDACTLSSSVDLHLHLPAVRLSTDR